MADFVQGLDPGKLVLSGAVRLPIPFSFVQSSPRPVPQVLSFVLGPFAAPAYNLPIFLFGALAHENSDAVLSLKLVRPHIL